MIKIRYATSRDFEQVFRLYKQVRPDADSYKNVLFDLFNYSIVYEKRFYLCAYEEDADDEIIGYCTVDFKTSLRFRSYMATVYEMIVGTNYRRKGLGQQLCAEAIALAKEAGCGCIEIHTGNFKEQTQNFYRKLGFKRKFHVFSMNIVYD